MKNSITITLKTHTGKVFEIKESDCFHLHIDNESMPPFIEPTVSLVVFKHGSREDPVIRIPLKDILTSGLEDEIPLLKIVNVYHE